ncbi:MAG: hypothetical protein PVI90_11725, partial [Desulfobacteraceae bacterium]
MNKLYKKIEELEKELVELKSANEILKAEIKSLVEIRDAVKAEWEPLKKIITDIVHHPCMYCTM